MGSFRDVAISNIVASGVSRVGCSITGLPGHSIENVSLSNILLTFEGGGTRELAAKKVQEYPQRYPECLMFGELPAYGFYCRHVNGLRLANVQLRTAAPDRRHAILCDDVENLALEGIDAAYSPGGAPLLGLIDVREAIVHGCQPRAKDGTFLRLAGAGSRNVTLTGNDLGGVAQPADVAADVPKDALRMK